LFYLYDGYPKGRHARKRQKLTSYNTASIKIYSVITT